MPTIKDVAQQAGVAISTVSRILNGDTRARPETVTRVRAAAADLGYAPSALGRGLRTRSQSVWALVIADIENPLFTGATRGVEDVASAAGYSVLLCNSDENAAKEREYLRIAGQLRVAGVVLTPTSPRVDVAALRGSGIPVVCMDRPLGGRVPATDVVLVDTRTAAYQAVTRLVAEGARRIGCVTGAPQTFTTTERVAGYREALVEAGLPTHPDLVRYTDFRIDSARDAAEWLLRDRQVDALMVTSSLMTVGALGAVAAQGRRVGTDLRVAAFDDAPWTSLLSPDVVLVSQPAYELGAAAGRMLLSRIETADQPVRSILLSASVAARTPAEQG
jgi:LacI family transcriptional regulator